MNKAPECYSNEAQQLFQFFPSMPVLAKAYIPFQYMEQLYPPMQGLDKGTVFPELDRPYGVDPEYQVDQ